MPFVAKCRSCGHILWAYTRAFLNMLMKSHESESHKDNSEDFDFCNWVILRVTHEQYRHINEASKSPAFWKAIRTNPKNIRF
jgi:hypothetical protein